MCRSPLSSPSSVPRHPMGDLGGPQFLTHRLSKLGRSQREKLRRSMHGRDRAGQQWLAEDMRALTFLWLFLQGLAGRRSSTGSTGPHSPLPHMATC